MERKEFIDKLRGALNGNVSPALVEENIRYYHEYINSEMRNGKSEEEVLDALGDPRLIARTIIETNTVEDMSGTYQTGAFSQGDGEFRQAEYNHDYDEYQARQSQSAYQNTSQGSYQQNRYQNTYQHNGYQGNYQQGNDYQRNVYHRANHSGQDVFQQSTHRTYRIPGWLWILIAVLVIVLIVSVVLSVVSFLAPIIIPILLVIFLIKLFRDWLN